MENDSEVLSGLVLGRLRDGRCRYDPQVKQELVRRCLQPGVSVARMAMQHGVNANLLRKWITQRQSRNAIAVQIAAPQDPSAFLAVRLYFQFLYFREVYVAIWAKFTFMAQAFYNQRICVSVQAIGAGRILRLGHLTSASVRFP
jgi:hypothetical protein